MTQQNVVKLLSNIGLDEESLITCVYDMLQTFHAAKADEILIATEEAKGNFAELEADSKKLSPAMENHLRLKVYAEILAYIAGTRLALGRLPEALQVAVKQELFIELSCLMYYPKFRQLTQDEFEIAQARADEYSKLAQMKPVKDIQ